MAERARLKTLVMDSARWDGFPFRDGDIVISTPPKCGTTWTQALCAYLIFGTTDLPRPMAELSPWLDMLTSSLDDLVALLEAQEHRRFIKSHTPLHMLPFDERVTYVCVGRDPRDVSLSWEHHMANVDFEALFAVRAAAVGLDDLAELEMPAPPPEDPVERFWSWADTPGDFSVSVSLDAILGHLASFWERRHEPNIVLLHYADLSSDLPGEIRRLAAALGIDVSDEQVERYAAAATFDSMRSRAELLAPDTTHGIWRSTTDFFHRGTSGQWRHLLDDEGLRRYDERVAELVPADLAAWAHQGRAALQ